ncbi:alpha/beta hydrolase [Olivibacter ginsenosidimutans]|uniref:Alpha/beta hydrolase n=2 Tax=Olivibacter ginsenosidimutans TaxID=1176537 RepID=A0ABP9BRU2_9SPHI
MGILFEQYARWKLERTAFIGRTFITIKGKRLHYVKKGQGNCTVVFQSGMGSSHGIWQDIQEKVANHAVTIAYDRNGIMLSENNGLPITNDQASEELQTLLEKTYCPKPYILVGHSMAANYLRPFIEQNRDHIQGIIFAEAAHPQLVKKASKELLEALKLPPRWLIKSAVFTGIYRLVYSFIPLSAEIPMHHHLHRLERDFFYRTCDKVLEELANERLNFDHAEQYTSFGTIPLTVIVGTAEVRYTYIKNAAIRDEFRELLNELQHDLLTLSANSRLVQAKNSGHILQIQDSALLIAEIERMIATGTYC